MRNSRFRRTSLRYRRQQSRSARLSAPLRSRSPRTTRRPPSLHPSPSAIPPLPCPMFQGLARQRGQYFGVHLSQRKALSTKWIEPHLGVRLFHPNLTDHFPTSRIPRRIALACPDFQREPRPCSPPISPERPALGRVFGHLLALFV